jgi:hypothetical protein
LYSVSTPELVFEILGHPDRFTKDVPSYREQPAISFHLRMRVHGQPAGRGGPGVARTAFPGLPQ